MKAIYPIQRWDAIIRPGAKAPMPTVYIQPDKRLIDFICKAAKADGSEALQVGVHITGTYASAYENKVLFATISTAEFTGGYRPNYQETTGYITLDLDTNWAGYPVELGEVEILDLSVENEEKSSYLSNIMNNFTADRHVDEPAILIAVLLAILILYHLSAQI